MKGLSAADIEIRAMQRAYDELKCLDPEGVDRALAYLQDRFNHEHAEARKAREAAVRERIAKRAHPTTGES